MIIRNETASDIDAITDVTAAAFKTLAISNHTEQFIINSLRAAEAFTISLVYERFGFRNIPGLVHEGIPQEVFLGLPFTENVHQGIVVFHEGFLANDRIAADHRRPESTSTE